MLSPLQGISELVPGFPCVVVNRCFQWGKNGVQNLHRAHGRPQAAVSSGFGRVVGSRFTVAEMTHWVFCFDFEVGGDRRDASLAQRVLSEISKPVAMIMS